MTRDCALVNIVQSTVSTSPHLPSCKHDLLICTPSLKLGCSLEHLCVAVPPRFMTFHNRPSAKSASHATKTKYDYKTIYCRFSEINDDQSSQRT